MDISVMKPCKLFSFDIFDTLLVRACGKPEVLFDILASRVLGDDSDSNKRKAFAAERIRAGWIARDKKHNNSDPLLDEIYSEADFSAFTDLDNNAILEIELNVESDMLVGVNHMRKIVNDCRSEGKVCFTSDMYLPSSFLTSILKRERFYRDGDSVYVSGDVGKSKVSGELYRHVMSENPDCRIVHYGDNRYSDGKVMKKVTHGKHIRIKHLFSPYQEKVSHLPDYDQLQRPYVLASLSKAVYISQPSKNHSIKFATDIIAPTLIPIVYEILNRASKAGCNKLFFFARDGKILYKIAKCFKPLFPEIKFEYLYLSRTSIYVPSLDQINEDTLNSLYLPVKQKGTTVAKFIRKYMPGLNFAIPESYDTIEKLCSDSELLKKLKDYHKEQQTLINEYFVDCGFASDSDAVGGVDLNGSGKTFEYLNTILKRFNHQPIKAYLYDLCFTADMAKRGEIDSISISERRYDHYDRISGLTFIFEDYIAATDDGRTTHYRRNEKGNVEPVFEEESEDVKEEHLNIFNLHTKICLEYAVYFIRTQAYTHNMFNVAAIQALLKDFGRNPLKEYVLPFTGQTYDISALSSHALVKHLKLKDLMMLIKYKGKYDSWARGSVVATYGRLGNFVIKTLGKLKRYRLNH